jgi:hypothetical protein
MSVRDSQRKMAPTQPRTPHPIEDFDRSFPAHLEKYRPYIQHLGHCEARQRELLEAMWLIMNTLVEHSADLTNRPSPPEALRSNILDQSLVFATCRCGVRVRRRCHGAR